MIMDENECDEEEYSEKRHKGKKYRRNEIKDRRE